MKKLYPWVMAATVTAGSGKEPDAGISWPPRLPGDVKSVTIEDDRLLQPGAELRDGVLVAKVPPKVRFIYYDCQTYAGKPWSVWGDGVVVDGSYYSSVGDHLSPEGDAYVYRYDPETGELTSLMDLRGLLNRPEGTYTPGKIHSRLDVGRDGWLYFSTHRGSTKVALDPANAFGGDWIVRVHPRDGEAEVVAHAPAEMQSLPTGMLDGERMIWYAGTADGLNQRDPLFLAYDVEGRETLFSSERGPHRAMILSTSTGKLYFTAEKPGGPEPGRLQAFDPRMPGKLHATDARLGMRAATMETPDGLVYTIDGDILWSFDVKTEEVENLGGSAVASQTYTTSIDADPTGRYLYYIPGAHGGAEKDGTPVVQYDTLRGVRKVICFLHPVLEREAGYIPIGTFGAALSEDGGTLFVTWNGAHEYEGKEKRVPFRSVGMTAIEIPGSERPTE